MYIKLFALAFLAAFVLPTSAFAQTATTTTIEKTTNAKVTDIKTRNEERKARLKTKLDAASQKNITGKCIAAQAKLKMVSAKLKETNEKYTPKYDAFILKTEKLEIALSQDGIKSSELLSQIAEAKTKLAAVKAAAESLQASVDDAAALDCKADPTGFKAAVDDAREQSKALTATKQDLTKYARTNLKTTLASIKATN